MLNMERYWAEVKIVPGKRIVGRDAAGYTYTVKNGPGGKPILESLVTSPGFGRVGTRKVWTQEQTAKGWKLIRQ